MHDAGRVGRGDAVGDLHGEVEQLAGPLDRRQRAAVEELHDQVVRPDVVQLADVRMIQCRDGAGFALEAVAELDGRLLDRRRADPAACHAPCRPAPFRRRPSGSRMSYGPSRAPGCKGIGAMHSTVRHTVAAHQAMTPARVN